MALAQNALLARVATGWLLAVALLFSAFATADADLDVDIMQLPPYAYQGSDGKITGVYYEITKLILETAQISATFRVIPVARINKRVERDKTDLIIFIESDWARKHLIELAPVFDNFTAVVAPNHAYTIKNLNDLKTVRISIVRGGTVNKYIEDKYILNAVRVVGYLQGARLMKAGRVDAMFGIYPSILWALRRVGFDMHQLGKPFTLNTSVIYLHANPDTLTKDQLATLKEVTLRLKQEGVFDRILRKHIGDSGIPPAASPSESKTAIP